MGIRDTIRDGLRIFFPDNPPESTPMTKQAPAPRGARAGSLTAEMGSTGLKHVGGVIVEEWQAALMGERGIRTWKEMSEQDPTVGAVLFAIEMLIRQVEWSTEGATEDEAEKEKADFLWDCMNDLDKPWVSTIAEILTMLAYGWSIHEIVYKIRRGQVGKTPSKYEDGRIGWKRLPIRGQDTLLQWILSETEDVEFFVQTHPVTFHRIDIPAVKFIHFKTKEKRGPEGISVLRNAWRPWTFKKRLEEIEAIGLERDLAGLPIAYIPQELMSATATADQKALFNDIKKIVRGIKVNEQQGVVFPLVYDQHGNEQYKLELLSPARGGGTKSKGPDQAIRRYKQDIAMTVLADFILLGHEKVGSFALSDSKTKIFASAMGAWMDTIADTINEQAVPRLCALNGIDGPYPRIVHGDIETPDLEALGDYILKLTNAGALTVPDQRLERHLRRAGDLPEQDEGAGDEPAPEPEDEPAVPPEEDEGEV